MKREFSAGGVVAKDNLWLIIKPRPSRLFPKIRFQLPKGLIEVGETTAEAALREVFEETGINASIVGKAGDSKFTYMMGDEKIFKIVSYFLMVYVSGELTTNEEVEELYWLPFKEARKKMSNSNDKKILDKAQELFSTIGPSTNPTS